MKENRKYKRSNIISFSESEVYAAEITDENYTSDTEKPNINSLIVVCDRNTDKVIGHLIDISEGGLLILCEAPIEKNTVYQLRMNFSSILNHKKTINFDARSVRICNDFDIDSYFSRFEFINIDSEDINIIKQLIDKFSDNNPSKSN